MVDLRAVPDLEDMIKISLGTGEPTEPIRQLEKQAANGVAELDGAGLIIPSQIPSNGALPAGYVDGADINWLTVATVSVGTAVAASKLRDQVDSFNINFTGILTADIMVSGKGGLDTGAEAADTWYALHVIADSTAVNAPDVVLSLSATAPTLPAGYDKSRRVAWVRNNPSSDFLKFFSNGKARVKSVRYDEDATNVRPLNGGTATTFATVSAAAFVPPTVEEMMTRVDFNNGSGPAGDDVRFRHPASTITSPVNHLQLGVSSGVPLDIPSFLILLDSSQDFQYQVFTGNSVRVVVQGWEDEL